LHKKEKPKSVSQSHAFYFFYKKEPLQLQKLKTKGNPFARMQPSMARPQQPKPGLA
jgi:hypothetical protein